MRSIEADQVAALKEVLGQFDGIDTSKHFEFWEPDTDADEFFDFFAERASQLRSLLQALEGLQG